MIRKGILSLGGAVALAIVATSPAEAANIRIDFTGTVVDWNEDEGDFGYFPGDSLSGHMILDDSVEPVPGELWLAWPGALRRLVVDGRTIDPGTGIDSQVRVKNDLPSTGGWYIDAASYEQFAWAENEAGFSAWSIRGEQATRTPGDFIQTASVDAITQAKDIGAYALEMSRERWAGGYRLDYIEAQLTSIDATYDVAPIPVPPALPLFAIGVALLAVAGRRRRGGRD